MLFYNFLNIFYFVFSPLTYYILLVLQPSNREDLTSLGSDDSGILCGSDSDVNTAATRESSVEQLAAHSRESLSEREARLSDSDQSRESLSEREMRPSDSDHDMEVDSDHAEVIYHKFTQHW